MTNIPNPELELAFNFVQYTNQNIFLTGKAGTGKTTFLKGLKNKSPKRMIVVAPTGVAAINAGGVTIHSFFQVPFGPQIPRVYIDGDSDFLVSQKNNEQKHSVKKLSKEKINIIKSIDLLVIDEISMVRADLLDAIDEVLRKFRDRSKPFGGIQLLMIGDLQQLAPVVKGDDWEILNPFYETAYFFSSKALQQTSHIGVELKHIYRQSDNDFISILNKIRENHLDGNTLQELNKRHLPDFANHDHEGYITLTTHNHKAQHINETKLSKISGRSYTFQAKVEGDFPEFSYPTEFELKLKVGAQVMFVKNDISKDKLYYNGKIGKVVNIDDDIIYVECDDEYGPIPVDKVAWDNTKYHLNKSTKEIEETIAGQFIQYPLKLAWAITIHKSQGLTFEKAIIDANASFAHGQVYVALSRCKSLEGMVLSSQIQEHSIKNDNTVTDFSKEIENNPPTKEKLNAAQKKYQEHLLMELFQFDKIQSAVYYCIKELKTNAGALLGNPLDNFQKINNEFKESVADISVKFQNQIVQLSKSQNSIEQNQVLQERIKKAVNYFLEKIDKIVFETIENSSIETDNRTVKKDIKMAFQKLGHEALVKKLCLKACKNGFVLKDYLNQRAKASLEKYDIKNQKTNIQKDQTIALTKNPEIFGLIKNWRNQKALETGLPHYMILHQKAVLELSHFLPSSIKQLKSIKGFGKKKVENYGEEIIELINGYCSDKKISQPEPDDILPGREPKPKKEKIDTKKISFDLFKSGKTVEEIAKEREMVTGTIEGHLSYYIQIGELDIEEVISMEKVNKIADYIKRNDQNSLSRVKEHFGQEVSWGELKMVCAFLNRIEN